MRFLMTIFICTIMCGGTLVAQSKVRTLIPRDSVPFNNRKYKQELGIAIDGLLSRSGGGSQLIWKIRDDRAKLIPVSYANYWRVRGGLNGYTFTGYRDSVNTAHLGYINTNAAYSNNHFWATIGRERNNFVNRFNFFYGWDAGPGLDYLRENTIIYTYLYDAQTGAIVGYQDVPILAKSLSMSAGASVFIGVKYHITDRISISVESAFNAYYSLVRRRVSVKDLHDTTSFTPSWYHTYGYNLEYLRFITLNYRFKRYS